MKAAATQFGPLPQLSCIRIEGKDAESFLQGQVTCDIHALEVSSMTHGAHCSAKGRMVANFDAIKAGEGLLLLVCASSVASILMESLKRYAIFSKVKISADPSILVHGIIGDSAPSVPGFPKDFMWPSATDQLTAYDDGFVYFYGDSQFIWLATGRQTVSKDQFTSLWSTKSCLNGRTWITEKTTDLFLPQSINLQVDAISGISFTKGCYTGQEVIARLHYKGRLKRRMHLFSCEGLAQEGIAIDKVCDKQGKAIGEVVEIAHGESTAYILCVLAENDAETPCYCDGQLMHRLADPYAIST